MKFSKVPIRKYKKFAWLPVFITTGAHDAGRYVWLEQYYTWLGFAAGGAGARRMTQTVSDYNYVVQMRKEIASNPDRYGYDPYRSWDD